MIPLPKYWARRTFDSASGIYWVDCIVRGAMVSWKHAPPPLDHTLEMRARYF